MIENQFIEVLIAPNFTSEAQEILNTKPNIRVLRSNDVATDIYENKMIHGVGLVQSTDIVNFSEMKLEHVTNNHPSKHEIDDLIFAMKVAKHAKSNAIVLTNNNSTVGIGSGQSSRLDSCKIAVDKMKKFNHNTKNLVAASDAFFPFVDGIESLVQSGVKAIIQPFGSIRDKDIIRFANNTNTVLVFSKTRHFRH